MKVRCRNRYRGLRPSVGSRSGTRIPASADRSSRTWAGGRPRSVNAGPAARIASSRSFAGIRSVHPAGLAAKVYAMGASSSRSASTWMSVSGCVAGSSALRWARVRNQRSTRSYNSPLVRGSSLPVGCSEARAHSMTSRSGTRAIAATAGSLARPISSRSAAAGSCQARMTCVTSPEVKGWSSTSMASGSGGPAYPAIRLVIRHRACGPARLDQDSIRPRTMPASSPVSSSRASSRTTARPARISSVIGPRDRAASGPCPARKEAARDGRSGPSAAASWSQRNGTGMTTLAKS